MTFEPNPEPTLPEAEPDELAAWADVSSTPRLTDDGSDAAPPAQPDGVSDAAADFFGFDDDRDSGRLGAAMCKIARGQVSIEAENARGVIILRLHRPRGKRTFKSKKS